jgi:uncharacterized Tic20 family protein
MTISGPPPVPASALRVSDAEREPVVERLQQAYAEGRLDDTQLDLRLHRAMTAKTRGDLGTILSDLDPPARLPGPPVTADPAAEERVFAALAHVLGIVTLFVGPLVMMCTRANRSSYVRGHIVSALNFQLTLLILTAVTLGVGALAYTVAWAVAGVAALLALAGTPFRYPFTLRLVR